MIGALAVVVVGVYWRTLRVESDLSNRIARFERNIMGPPRPDVDRVDGGVIEVRIGAFELQSSLAQIALTLVGLQVALIALGIAMASRYIEHRVGHSVAARITELENAAQMHVQYSQAQTCSSLSEIWWKIFDDRRKEIEEQEAGQPAEKRDHRKELLGLLRLSDSFARRAVEASSTPEFAFGLKSQEPETSRRFQLARHHALNNHIYMVSWLHRIGHDVSSDRRSCLTIAGVHRSYAETAKPEGIWPDFLDNCVFTLFQLGEEREHEEANEILSRLLATNEIDWQWRQQLRSEYLTTFPEVVRMKERPDTSRTLWRRIQNYWKKHEAPSERSS